MEKLKEINISFFLLLVLFMQVIISDTIIYFFNARYIVAQIIGLIINIIINILLIKKVYKIKHDFSKWDSIFFIIIFLMFIATIAFPNRLSDTYTYHLYLQKYTFTDKINEDFFPGRTVTSFIFPIIDRLFYLFRSKLGFRLGTLPSYFIFIVIFYQIKKIIKKFVGENLKPYQLSILSILPIGTFILLQQVGSYYIDNFSVSLLLEFSYIILFENENLFKNKKRLYFLAFLVGLIVCTKLTNAVYLILPIIYILIHNIKDIKNIKWYDYIFLIITALLPLLPYLLDTILQTGSPVFPYYNTIFKSKYFANENWVDNRFGTKNLFEVIVWPIYIIIFPRRAYETSRTDLNFGIGYIISIIYLLYILCKRIFKKEKIKLSTNILYCIYIIYLCLIWAKFSIGYTRYAGIIPVLSSILVIKLLISLIDKKAILSTIVVAFILAVASISGFYEWITHNVLIYYENNLENLKTNVICLLKDQDYLKYDIDGIWGVITDDSGIPSMLNVDDRIVQLSTGFKIGETEASEKIYWDNVLNNDIYVPIYGRDSELKLKELDDFHFEITEIASILPNVLYLENATPIYIIKVKYNENKTTPNFILFNQILENKSDF